jgi:hypothetical protein
MTTMQTYAVISGWTLYKVYIGNNYYDGRYANYSYRPYQVIAQSEDQAKELVLANANHVLNDLLKIKIKQRRLLSKSKAVPITDRGVGIAELSKSGLSTLNFIDILTPAGISKVKFSHGIIEDMILPNEITA